MNLSVIDYYDYLIDDNNDPVLDAAPLREYMDKWDGQKFIKRLNLTNSADVLEIGVGTGRLAVRTAPYCKTFCGIDISPKTIEKAKENLRPLRNIKLICNDFLSYRFENSFDVIYSTLTFMHISQKQAAINKIYRILNRNGRFVLSIDKNQKDFIHYGAKTIKIFPDDRNSTEKMIINAGFKIEEIFETEFAYIFIGMKSE